MTDEGIKAALSMITSLAIGGCVGVAIAAFVAIRFHKFIFMILDKAFERWVD